MIDRRVGKTAVDLDPRSLSITSPPKNIDTIAARRMVFSTNPVLRDSKAIIEQYPASGRTLSYGTTRVVERSSDMSCKTALN
jgi:hypothetical protein